MLVASRETKQYDEYAMPSKETFGYFNRSYDDFDDTYEAKKRDTSNGYRDELLNNLQFHQARSESKKTKYRVLDREEADNNFDKMWDRKYANASAEPKQKRSSFRGKKSFVITYCVLAAVTVIAVALSLVNFNAASTATAIGSVALSTPAMDTANAEVVNESGVVAALPEEEVIPSGPSGEDYIRLADGTLLQVSIPTAQKATSEKENGFDKFCNWLNGAFGG